MNSTKSFRQIYVLTLIVLLLVGCSGSQPEPTATHTPEPTATLPPQPPCYGLTQANSLPEWAGGLAFGEKHTFGLGEFTDLTNMTGCEVEGGVIAMHNENGKFLLAYVDNCDSFELNILPGLPIPTQVGDSWICNMPTTDGYQTSLRSIK